MSFKASETSDPGGESDRNGCIRINMPNQDQDLNEDETEVNERSSSPPLPPCDTDADSTTASALTPDTVPEDFRVTHAICLKITKEILNHREVLEHAEDVSLDLLEDANDLFTIGNKIRQGLQLGPIFMSIFTIWMAKAPPETTTVDTLIHVLSHYDQRLEEKLMEPNTRAHFWQLAQRSSSGQAIVEARQEDPTASSSNTVEVTPSPNNINEHVDEQVPLMALIPDSGTETMASNYVNNLQFAQLQETASIVGKLSAASSTSTIADSVQQDQDQDQEPSPNQNFKYACIGIGIVGFLIVCGVVYYVWIHSGDKPITGNPLITTTTTAKTIFSSPNGTTPLLQVSPSPIPEQVSATTSTPLHTPLKPINPEASSKFVTCLLDTTLWLTIFASYSQDWTNYVLPSHCSVENVHVLELSGNINLKSLHYLLSEYKSIRVLIVHGLSVKRDNDEHKQSDYDDYNYKRVISLKLLQKFVIHDGQLRPQFYDFFSTTTVMPALQELTIQNSSLHIPVVRSIQKLFATVSNSLIRLNLNLLDVGSQKLFTHEICDRFAQFRSLQIIVTLPDPENVNYQGLKFNLMEVESCNALTSYRYNRQM